MRNQAQGEKKSHSRVGFTLIEMMVVVFVVGIGLVGALSFFNINLNSQFEAKKELVAAGLAQEGADLVRNLVDFKRMQSGAVWSTFAPTLEGSGCGRIDYRSLSEHACNQGDTVKICLSNGRYQQCPGGTDTGMTRKVTVDYLSNKSLKIIVDVEWNGRKTTAEDIIYENIY